MLNAFVIGCRKRDEDFLYEKELKELVATKKLTEVIVAFSREQKEKVYVQHKMIEKSNY
jgi:NADPH-ferrihemoprotein reductase